MPDRPPFTHSVKPPKGEAQVWLSAMGLAVGIVMVVGLLGLILKRGTDVFWPKRVMEIRLREGGPLLAERVLHLLRLRQYIVADQDHLDRKGCRQDAEIFVRDVITQREGMGNRRRAARRLGSLDEKGQVAIAGRSQVIGLPAHRPITRPVSVS